MAVLRGLLSLGLEMPWKRLHGVLHRFCCWSGLQQTSDHGARATQNDVKAKRRGPAAALDVIRKAGATMASGGASLKQGITKTASRTWSSVKRAVRFRVVSDYPLMLPNGGDDSHRAMRADHVCCETGSMLNMCALALAGNVRLFQDQRHQGVVTDTCGISPPRLQIACSRWQ